MHALVFYETPRPSYDARWAAMAAARASIRAERAQAAQRRTRPSLRRLFRPAAAAS